VVLTLCLKDPAVPASCLQHLRSLRCALVTLLLAGLAGMAMAQAQETLVSTNPTPNPVSVGQSVNVDVLVTDVSDLYGYEFSLNFNPAVLQYTSASPGSFLGGAGNFGVASFDNTLGLVSFVFDTFSGVVAGVSGSGTLSQLAFSAIGVGTSQLAFSDVTLVNSNLEQIFVTSFDGTVTAVPEPTTALLMALGMAGLWLGRRAQTRS
jgi:Cohesin domain/PEP-CTERM motif